MNMRVNSYTAKFGRFLCRIGIHGRRTVIFNGGWQDCNCHRCWKEWGGSAWW